MLFASTDKEAIAVALKAGSRTLPKLGALSPSPIGWRCIAIGLFQPDAVSLLREAIGNKALPVTGEQKCPQYLVSEGLA